MKSGTSKTSTNEGGRKTDQIELKDLEAQVESLAQPKSPPQAALSPELAQSLPSPVNDIKDTISTFLDKIAVAKAQGEYFIETSPEVFHHYMRDDKSRYFHYMDVRVYKYGEREDIERDEQRTV